METPLSVHEAWQLIYKNAFATNEIGRIGVELEWLVFDRRDRQRRVSPADISPIMDTATALPAGGRLSFEPGGQLELSTLPAPNIADCLTAAAKDLDILRQRLQPAGFELVGQGLDARPPQRVLSTTRYAALETNYDRLGPAGRTIMCNTASAQVNIDAGDDSSGWRGRQRRWRMANLLGPVLIAMFANSPGDGAYGGRSCRQVLRFHTDPTRTNPVRLDRDCRSEWAEYVLDAHVIGIPAPEPQPWAEPTAGMTMRSWLRECLPRPATIDDLMEHLRSVIPPVRARGYLELRMIDAQDGDDWTVPAVMAAAIFDDEQTSDRAAQLANDLLHLTHRDDWITAARTGLSHPTLAAVARKLIHLVLDAIPRLGLPSWAVDAVPRFAERYTNRGRCPADDRTAPQR